MAPRISWLSVITIACLGGCATEGPQPTEELARAKTLIEQADKAGAQRFDAADLQRAHDEMNSAERASGERKYGQARRHAEAAAAAAAADVANARAAAGEARRAAHEVSQANETVREESERAATSTTAPRVN